VQTDSGIILPKGMELTLLEAARSGTGDYKQLHDTMDETIAKTVIGQSMTSESRGGQYKSEMQHDVRQDLVKADADLICESFNLTVARWLTAWNFSSARPPRVYRVVDEPEDLKTRADRDAVVASMGYKPSLRYITDTYGGDWEDAAPPADNGMLSLPSPGKGAVHGAAQSATPGAPGGATAFAETQDPKDVASRMAPQLDQAMQPVMTRWISKLREVVDKAKSLEDVRDGVLALQPDMSIDDYATVMAQALAAAALAGKHDIVNEAAP
jgi:phage gp29-like protein